MKLSYQILLLILSLCLIEIEACPSRKICRKKQAQKLRSMKANDAVTEATYIGKDDGKYKFVIDKTWGRHNGSLELQSVISVDTTGFKYRDCYEKVKLTRSYVLVLRAQKNAIFTAIAPPLRSEKAGVKHRRLIWRKLCATLEDGRTCRMRVTIPSFQIVYIGRIELITCDVETSAPIANMRWLKDGKNVENKIYQKAGVYMNREGSNAYIAIYNANHIHNGEYECIVTAEDGQEARASTHVEVYGPEAVKDLTCDKPNFCLNGGTCRKFSSSITSCACRDGFIGNRCQDVMLSFETEATHDLTHEALESQVSQLTIAIVLVAMALVCVLLFGSFYVFKLRRKLRPATTDYDAVDQSASTDHPETSTTLNAFGGTELTTIRLSVSDVPEKTESRRSSAAMLHPSLNTRHSSTRSSRCERATLTPSIESSSRHNSTGSESSSRRSRLYAKS